MGEREEVIVQLPSRERSGTAVIPDFHIIYSVGRTLKAYRKEKGGVEGKYICREGKFNVNGISKAQLVDLQRCLGVIIDLAESKLELSFLELSLFDPDDDDCRAFYTVLVGDQRVVEPYKREMEFNLEASRGNDVARGIILPNPALYESPLYSARYKPPVPCPKLDLENASIFFGVYDIPDNFDELNLPNTPERIKIFAMNFFDAVLKDALQSKEGDVQADSAFLMPISRPAGPVVGDEGWRLRGGGLFLFGRWNDEEAFHPGRFGLLISNALNRAVLSVSYTSFEHTRELERQSKDAYVAQAHEGRKVISLIGTQTPPHVLEQIKQYFNTLYAGTYDVGLLEEIPDLLPPEFAKGETFREFVKNAMRVAGRIEYMVREAARGKVPETNQQLETASARATEFLEFDKSCEFDLQMKQIDYTQRWALCSALICIFRNVLKNGEPDSTIRLIITHDNDGPLLVTRNTGLGRFDAVAGINVPVAVAPGKTLDALRYFVSQYTKSESSSKRIRMGWLNKTDLTYETVVPLIGEYFDHNNNVRGDGQ